MGTNFYWRDSACAHCNRYEEIHVGKRSAGWSFGFRAWPHQLMNADHPDWGHNPASPFGFKVMKREEWRKVFAERTGQLFDEYGQHIEDPVAWLDALIPPTPRERAWEDAERYRYGGRGDSRDFRDREGFRFYAGEFC